MPPAISPTSLSCAYRKQCRVRTTSTCTSCSTRSLQACRFTPRLAQMAAAVSPLHHPFTNTCIYLAYNLQEVSDLFLFVRQCVQCCKIRGLSFCSFVCVIVTQSNHSVLNCLFQWATRNIKALRTTIINVKNYYMNASVKSSRFSPVLIIQPYVTHKLFHKLFRQRELRRSLQRFW